MLPVLWINAKCKQTENGEAIRVLLKLVDKNVAWSWDATRCQTRSLFASLVLLNSECLSKFMRNKKRTRKANL